MRPILSKRPPLAPPPPSRVRRRSRAFGCRLTNSRRSPERPTPSLHSLRSTPRTPASPGRPPASGYSRIIFARATARPGRSPSAFSDPLRPDRQPDERRSLHPRGPFRRRRSGTLQRSPVSASVPGRPPGRRTCPERPLCNAPQSSLLVHGRVGGLKGSGCRAGFLGRFIAIVGERQVVTPPPQGNPRVGNGVWAPRSSDGFGVSQRSRKGPERTSKPFNL